MFSPHSSGGRAAALVLCTTLAATGCNRLLGIAKKKPPATAVATADPAAPVLPPIAGGPPVRFPVPNPALPGKGPEWAGGVRLPGSHARPPALGPAGCPVAIAADKVWDLAKDRPVGDLFDLPEYWGTRALSPDGRWFAAGTKQPNQDNTPVAVWSTETGRKVCTIPGMAGEIVDVLTFAGDGLLFVGGRETPALTVWDVTTGQKVRTVTPPGGAHKAGTVAVSPDGRYVAGVGRTTVEIQEVESGRSVATLTPARPRGLAPAAEADEDPVFVLAWVKALQFSPDGQELAMLSSHPKPHVVVWNTRGQQVYRQSVPEDASATDYGLDWLPDKSGWLANGKLIDRAAKRVILNIPTKFAAAPARLVDGTRVALEERRGDGLDLVPIPWDKLRASLSQWSTGAPAYLSPAAPVSVEVDVAGARGDVAETRRLLTDAVTRRLAADGVTVAPGQPTVVKVMLAEKAGDSIPIYEKTGPLRPGFLRDPGRDTGRKATEAKGALVVEITAAGEKDPLWRGTITAGNARSFSEDITDAVIRKSMLDDAARQIERLSVPYFIPKDKDGLVLPAVME